MGRDTAEDTPGPGLVDAHTHLDDEVYDADLPQVLARARAAGVRRFVVCGARPDRWARTLALRDDHGAAVFLGLHPWIVSDLAPERRDTLLHALETANVDGIGELGLDAARARTDDERRTQRDLVRAQLDIARRRGLPVVLHGVRAWPELLDLVERARLPRGGVAHGWSGPPELVPRALRLGLYLSFGPRQLDERATRARRSAARVPADRLLAETDCPSSPGSERRGEPADVVAVVAGLAALRGETPEETGRATSAAFSSLMGVSGA